ncbi:universal stress protein [Enterococcus avium]|uniref:universal stress protein n=1 Tax=Enterococcus avium TaxID=33945 RepID=UPI001F5A9EEB|nr:universal stress protein [Enterococcus avium]
MEKYKKILVAFDGSSASKNALYEVMDIIKAKGNMMVTVLIVTDTRQVMEIPQILKVLEEEYLELKEQVELILEQTISYKIVHVTGSPRNIIVSLAEKEDMDLIIIGATGIHGIEKVLVGSTASYVVNHAPCNILMVK